ncbi:hypothetical protein BCR34DRAFT_587350 [Clohesyomyces aquaticus]|uniref:Uncharacterized protein n=1 Tax=Clohesyomyces aquaticus TaxID=1231657 RepID=A0A1Y1ZPN0_9PLEO|nr:hypothetical protein BCR34DRAFT_587350 [Clohesyomyces aquaticus]
MGISTYDIAYGHNYVPDHTGRFLRPLKTNAARVKNVTVNIVLTTPLLANDATPEEFKSYQKIIYPKAHSLFTDFLVKLHHVRVTITEYGRADYSGPDDKIHLPLLKREVDEVDELYGEAFEVFRTKCVRLAKGFVYGSDSDNIGGLRMTSGGTEFTCWTICCLIEKWFEITAPFVRARQS